MADEAATRDRAAAAAAAAEAAGRPPAPGGPLAASAAVEEEMPRIQMTRRNVLLFVLFVASALAFLYFVLPRLAGLQDTWQRAQQAAAGWLVLAAVLEILSFGGYIMLFRTVFIRGGEERITWAVSYQITMASLAATRLFAAAGAGGVALTAWALRRSGMEARVVACRMVAFLMLLYAVFMASLVICGFGLRFGVLPGNAPFGVTVVPAAFGAVVILIFLAMALLPSDFERRLEHWARGTHRRAADLARRVATAPAAVASGVRTAMALIRRREIGTLGAVAWWGFDIATLWACFQAFGGDEALTVPVLVLGYFVGQLANVLPLPGGIGGVDGGLIGAFIALGVDGGLAVVAVLVYRGFAFWLPTVPGIVAYLQLRKTVKGWRAATIQSEATA